jgi:hypothetical protein
MASFDLLGRTNTKDQYIQVVTKKGEPGAFGMTIGKQTRWVKTIPNPDYKAPAAAAPTPAPPPPPAPAPPPPPVVEQPKVAFEAESFSASPYKAQATSTEEQRKPFVADTEARDYDHFVKGLEKINPPEATSSESSRGSDAGGMRFAASQKFRDGINERLGIKDQMNDTETDDDEDDDAYSWRQERNRSSFSRGLT